MPQVKKTLIKLVKDLMSKLYMERTIRPIMEDQGFVPSQSDEVNLTPEGKPTKRMVIGAYLDCVDWTDPTTQDLLAPILDEVLVKRNLIDYVDVCSEAETQALLERTLAVAQQCGYFLVNGSVTTGQTSLTYNATATSVFDIPSIQTEFTRMRDFVRTDANQAITAALCLLESVCKHLLDAKQISYDEKASATELIKLVIESYRLQDGPLGQETKHFLRASVHQVSEARRLFGTAHGRSSAAPISKLPLEKGELVIDLCYTIAKYLLQTGITVQ
jgi:hypothetical protein